MIWTMYSTGIRALRMEQMKMYVMPFSMSAITIKEDRHMEIHHGLEEAP